MIIRCAWHPKYVGQEKIIGRKKPYNEKITDGICDECFERLSKEIEESKNAIRHSKEETKKV